MEIPWLISASLLFIIMLIKFLSPNKEKKLRLPPGPRKLPIIGNLHQLASKRTPPHRRLAELAGAHGPIMHLRLGEVPAVVFSSADTAREVTKTYDTNFANRPELMVGKILYHGNSEIGLAPYGEYWRQLRKIATLELFTVKRVRAFRAVREEEVDGLVESIASEANSGGSLVVVNLSDKVFGLMFNITYWLISSKRGKDRDAFRQFITKQIEVLSGFNITDFYPSRKLLHSIGGVKRKLEQMVRDSDKLLDPIIEEHKSEKKQRDEIAEDLVDVLLRFHKETPDSSEFSLSSKNIKAIILELFAAGSETSYGAIEWAMSELLRHPRAMKKAQAEVRQVYKGRQRVDEASLGELKFLKLVIKETLRLHPPAPLLVPRESIEGCQIHGYDIPPKTRVMINAWAIARDPSYWPDPNSFMPERFEDSSIDYKGTDFEFIPFGAGRRMCPGMALGIANVELPLAALLYHFDWKLPGGTKPEDLDMEELFGLTVRRKTELCAIATPYVPSSLVVDAS